MSMPAARHVKRLTGLVVIALLLTALPGCILESESDLEATVVVYGPLRGYLEDQDGRRLGYALDQPQHVGTSGLGFVDASTASQGPPEYIIGFAHPGRYTGTFRVVEASPILLQVLAAEPVEGFLTTRGGFVTRALFFIAAPPGATVKLSSFRPGQDPEDLRLTVDRESDGTVDQELTPVGWQEADDLSFSSPGSRADVQELADGRARVSLRGIPSRSVPAEVQLYYTLYPQQPVAQLYEGPFIVDEPGYLLYGAFDANGGVGRVYEKDLLGGLAPDVESEVPTDGTPVEIEFTEPGQKAVLPYRAPMGDHFEVLIEESTVGVLPDGGLAFGEGVGRAGAAFYFDIRSNARAELRLDPEWGYTGTVRLRLINLTEHAPLLEVGGSPIEVEVRPEQRQDVLRFEGRAGEQLELHAVEVEIDEGRGTGVLNLSVLQPDGKYLLRLEPIKQTGDQYQMRLRSSGLYLVTLTSDAGTTGSVMLELTIASDRVSSRHTACLH